jgi:proteasome lid subunit RPN8/RPN11
MTDTKDVELTASTASDIAAHAADAHPEECCGFVVRRGGEQCVARVTNIQNALHADDPQHFPRTAATAYTMGPNAVPLLIAHERGDLVIEAIYHSHPGHEAYFSAEDCRLATPWGEPTSPDTAQIVVSVCAGRTTEMKAFRWNGETREFTEVRLRLV